MAYWNPSDKSEPWPADTAWIKRNPDIWIHGKTNFETPPLMLDEAGFLTPQDMFFVRQHSEVPRCVPEGSNPDDHKFFIEQVVHDTEGKPSSVKKIELTLGDLKDENKFKKVVFTSMLSCSGQRRREQNLVEKTGGAISWHNSTGNANWGGVFLRDVLQHFGVNMDHSVSKFVEFKGKEGYGGCIPFHKAMNPYGDVLVCWEMNGQPLEPDHGQPLRALVPGYSAKCSSKWLTGISVRDRDSEFGKHKSYYKLLPASMRPGTEEYNLHHKDPEYIIGELNVNSVIFEPHSNTRVAAAGPLKVTGYAHTGGGRPLSRIEVSPNGGKTWEQVRPLKQELTEAGQLWAWVRFEHTLSNFDPDATDAEIVVRAWDTSANTQPDYPQWNYTGMLNNHLYRVKVVQTETGAVAVHPAQWMDKEFKPKPVDIDSSEPVDYTVNFGEILNGEWRIGGFKNSIINLSATGERGFSSAEARFAGQKVTGEILEGPDGELQVQSSIGGFALTGTCFKSSAGHFIRWKNGMTWQKRA